jgi:hypothetical protein
MTPNYATAIQALAPNTDWSMTNANDYATLVWNSQSTAPTKAECDTEIATQTAQEPLAACKQQASGLLYATDWTTIPDVSDSAVSNPYLLNASEFAAYRSQVRQLAVNPVIDPVFPPVPTAQWSS